MVLAVELRGTAVYKGHGDVGFAVHGDAGASDGKLIALLGLHIALRGALFQQGVLAAADAGEAGLAPGVGDSLVNSVAAAVFQHKNRARKRLPGAVLLLHRYRGAVIPVGDVVIGVGVGEGRRARRIILAVFVARAEGVTVRTVIIGAAGHMIQRVGVVPAGVAARYFAQIDVIPDRISISVSIYGVFRRLEGQGVLRSARAIGGDRGRAEGLICEISLFVFSPTQKQFKGECRRTGRDISGLRNGLGDVKLRSLHFRAFIRQRRGREQAQHHHEAEQNALKSSHCSRFHVLHLLFVWPFIRAIEGWRPDSPATHHRTQSRRSRPYASPQ